MNGFRFVLTIVLTTILAVSSFAADCLFNAPMSEDLTMPTKLRCERQVNPVGVAVRKPLFSWYPGPSGQSAYRIRVFADIPSVQDSSAAPESHSLVWDSGWVESSEFIDVEYEGHRLESGRGYSWAVQLKDADGNIGEISESQHFVTAFFEQSDWGGEWIGYERANPWDREDFHSELSARYFRTVINVTRKVRAAYAHVCGIGYHEFHIGSAPAAAVATAAAAAAAPAANEGTKVGDRVLSPLASEYNNEVLSISYDVTDRLTMGRNVLGLVLGNGYYYNMQQGFAPRNNHSFGYPKLRFELDIFYEDGNMERICSSARGWKMNCDGPVRVNNMYDGEVYDARKELDAWLDPQYDDSAWKRPEAVNIFGQALIRPQPVRGMKVCDRLPVRSLTKLGDSWMLDFGQNLTGWVRMKVRAERGDTVRIDFAEKLYPDGTLDKSNLRDSYARDLYIARGDAEESWAPVFSYHGFRYALVSGLGYEPSKEDFVAEYISDDVERTGWFETDDEVFNRVIANAVESIRGTWKGVPLDCPQRSKRLPWLGDRNIEHLGEMYLFDLNSNYEYWFSQIALAQRADGCIPDVAPAYWYNYTDNVSWPSVFVIGALNSCLVYGNRRAMEDNYDSMVRWIRHLEYCYGDEGIMTKDRYGDWGVPPEDRNIKHTLDESRKTDGMLISTAYHYYLLRCMSHIAGCIGRDGDVPQFEAEAARVMDAFNGRFYDDAHGYYGNGTLTANILPASLGMVPAERMEGVRNAVRGALDARGGQVSSGVIGLQWMMRGLHRLGLDDYAYHLAVNTDYPSYGYMVKNGATTIWEYWNGDSILDSSHNHVMLLGDLIPWCFEDLAGIRASSPAFASLRMEPAFATPFNHIRAVRDTPYGRVTSEWNRKKCGQIVWEICIPEGVAAEVVLPDRTVSVCGGAHKFTVSASVARELSASAARELSASRKGI